MNLFVIAGIVLVLALLTRMRIPILGWVLIWLIAVYSFVTYGISPPVPSSIVELYLALTAVGLLAYIFCDNERYDTVSGQVTELVVNPRYKLWLTSVVILLPLLLATKVYLDLNVPVRAHTFGRTIHPAPPNEIDFKGKKINLITGKNPFRELEHANQEEFKQHLENGSRVYYQNCVFCHGDDMNGDGMFAHGFNPVPANLNSPTTIGMLQESYLFWRIAKGGPGLPEESGPWSSSMPAWESFLSEEEIWDVILFLYAYTEQKPRAEEAHH